MAASWLVMNTANFRRLSENRVAQYAKDMADGLWKACPDVIAFKDGVLLNGQHRLHAQVRAGVTIDWVVSFDWDGDVFDEGGARTPAIIFTGSGINYAKCAASICRMLLEQDAVVHKTGSRSSQALLDVYYKNQDLIDRAARIGHNTYIQSSQGFGLACYKILRAGWEDDFLKEFLSRVHSGEGFRGDPRFALSTRLRGKDRLAASQVAYMVITAFNAHAQGLPLHRVIMPEIGSKYPPITSPVKRLNIA